MTYLLALDQGTSSSRSIVFDADGAIVAMAQQEITQIYPHPGWVEHDPLEIWRTQLATAREVLLKAAFGPIQKWPLALMNNGGLLVEQREMKIQKFSKNTRPLAATTV